MKIEFIKCIRCSGRGHVFEPDLPCYQCKGSGRILLMDAAAFHHLLKMLGSCERKLRRGDCDACGETLSAFRTEADRRNT